MTALTRDPTSHPCHSRQLLRRISGRWTLLTLLALRDGPLRFSELGARIGDPSSKVLSQTLRLLTEDGLLERESFAEVPPRVEYRLTPFGAAFMEPVDAIVGWVHEHEDALLAARAAA